jgi:hypothetical protein
MRHVSLHDTIDTPSHTPAHTRLLERTPPYNIKIPHFAIYYYGHAGPNTKSSSESDFDMVINLAHSMQGWKHMGSTGIAFSIWDESVTTLHNRDVMCLCQRFPQTQSHVTTSSSRCHMRHYWLSGDDIRTLHKLSKRCWRWCRCSHVGLGLHNCQNVQFSCPVLHIFRSEVVSSVPPSWLHGSV